MKKVFDCVDFIAASIEAKYGYTKGQAEGLAFDLVGSLGLDFVDTVLQEAGTISEAATEKED